MARILMASLQVDGHVNPGFPLAAKLIQSGHEVRWYTGQRFQQRIEAIGARYLPMTKALDISNIDLNEIMPERAKLKGIRQLGFDMKQIFIGEAQNHLRDLQDVVTTYSADVTVADMGSIGAAWLAEMGGPPVAAYGVTFVPAGSRDVAPIGLGLPPSRSLVGRTRNRILSRLMTTIMFGSAVKYANEIRAEFGLPRITGSPFEMLVRGCQLYLQPCTCLFEYPRSDLPRHIHYIGPLLPQAPTDFSLPNWWDDLKDDRPVVLVTQGTVATQHEDLLLPTLRALASENVLVVATMWNGKAEDLPIAKASTNSRIEKFIPYSELLPHVDVMVTNEGYGGVQFALAHGVPLVVAGRTEDKPEIGARVAWSGVGIRLKSERPGEAAIRESVMKVLGNSSYRTKAKEHEAHSRGYGGAEAAVQLIEELVATKRPVLWSN